MNRTTSRTFLYGSKNGTPFHFSTMTLLEEPIPIANRPGAASAIAATLCAITGAVRVYAGTIAVPNRSLGSHAAASARGVNASAPSVSADQISLKPQSASCASLSRCACKCPGSGTVIPLRRIITLLLSTFGQSRFGLRWQEGFRLRRTCSWCRGRTPARRLVSVCLAIPT